MLRITVLVLCSLLSSCNSEPTETAFQIPKIYPHHGKSVCDRIFRLLSVSGFDDISNSLKTPRTLDESFVELDHMVNDQMKMWIRCLEDGEFAGRAHFSLGMYLRNNWGLWRGTTRHHPCQLSTSLKRGGYPPSGTSRKVPSILERSTTRQGWKHGFKSPKFIRLSII